MKTKNERVLEVLLELGFQTNQLDNGAYHFTYEGNNYLYLPNLEDETFLCICIPCIYSQEDGEQDFSILLQEWINSEQRYVKTYKVNGELWLFYEREIITNEDLKDVIAHMIMHLDISYYLGLEHLKSLVKDNDETIEENVN